MLSPIGESSDDDSDDDDVEKDEEEEEHLAPVDPPIVSPTTCWDHGCASVKQWTTVDQGMVLWKIGAGCSTSEVANAIEDYSAFYETENHKPWARKSIKPDKQKNARRPTNDNTTNNQRGTGTSQKVNCYECGNQGHYRRDCPERKNQSHKNQIGVIEKGKLYALSFPNVNFGFPKVSVPHQLKDSEKNYTTHMIRTGAVMFASQIWRTLFYETIVLRCSPITRVCNTIYRSKRVELEEHRWLELLCDYGLRYSLSPGKANVVDDALSREKNEKPHLEFEP
ncbi:putative reverse transcriptase domain-containing protein [Tanacetum coccineum]|uniref:Reverse transcriptase domain-containing protein n=1 Tax=Tanacetum coccineum TaxID=301880 RepID=A0ABQ5EW02_9ASTR